MTENIDRGYKEKQSHGRSNKRREEIFLSKKRFLILLLLSLALFANGEAWMTFGSVEAQSIAFFNASSSEILWLGNIFLVAYAIEAIPCTFMPQIIGVRGTILSGMALNFLGALLRLIGVFVSMDSRIRYILCLIGNGFFGLAQGFLLNVPALVSAVWFGENERPISTAVAYMSNSAGVGIGFLDIFLTIGFATSIKAISVGFIKLAVFQAILSLFVFLTSIFVFSEAPPNAPSRSQLEKIIQKLDTSLVEAATSMIKTMIHLLLKFESAVLLFIYATNYGSYVTMFLYLPGVLKDIVIDENYLNGYIGSIGIILGGVFTILVGYLMNFYRNKYNKTIGLLVNLSCAIPLLIIYALAITSVLNSITALIFFVLYFSMCPVYMSVGSEILADNTYPTDPNISSNEALILGNIVGAVTTYSFQNITNNRKYFTIMGLLISFYVCNSLLLGFIRLKFPRREIDRKNDHLSTQV